MKKLIFLISLFFCVSCTPISTGYEDSSPSTAVDPEITKLKLAVSILQTQLAAREKFDSTINVKVNSEATKLKNFMYVFSSDSIKQWIKINSAYTLVSRFPKDSALKAKDIKALATKARVDSIKTAAVLKGLTPLTRYIPDSTKQWSAIKILQSASPVTQIPIIQSQIKIIQSKDLSQDKIISSHTSSIKNVEDTINVLKVDAGSDFTLDAAGKFQISPAGMVRIKASIVPLP